MRDSEFRKSLGHTIVADKRIPCDCYTYETRLRLYCVYVFQDAKRPKCSINGSWTVPHWTHKEIVKHFNLGVDL